jgi:hypothetical protein
MITTPELVKTVILGISIVFTLRMLKKPKSWNEIELIGRKK